VRKTIVLLFVMALGFGSVRSFSVSYGDTLKYQTFHNNGKIKMEGIKVKKFREGLWKYYNRNGKMIKADLYKMGVRVNSVDMSKAD